MDEVLQHYFTKLDRGLKALGRSDSAIEYAPHIREEFDEVIDSINYIRTYLGGSAVNADEYFKEE